MAYRTEKLDGHTWMIEEYDEISSIYMYLLEGEDRAILIDAGLGQIPLDEIVRGLTDRPVEVLNTHGHVDHIGGNSLFGTVHMSELERGVYQYHCNEFHQTYFPQYPFTATEDNIHWFQGEPEFDLGGRKLQVILTPGHTEGAVCVLDVNRKWLFTGDTCCQASVLLSLEYATTVETYRSSIEKLLERKEEYILTWPAHHVKPVEPEIIGQFKEACDLLLEHQEEGIRQETILGESYLYSYKNIAIEYRIMQSIV